MRTLKYLVGIALILFMSCDKDNNDLSAVGTAVPPSDVSLAFQITQDNSGMVSITPNGTGAVTYNIGLGDGTEEQASVKQGETYQHVYAEGTYTLTVEAVGITGLKTETTQDLTVSFKAPENLEITAGIDPANPFQVNVSATADYAASFEVYFDSSNPDETPTPMQIGETVSFEYPAVGDYTIKVVALSGGAETTEGTATVTVNVPVTMPVDFEVFDASKFAGFGGCSAEVVANPDMNRNESATFGKIVKNGPEVWAGDVITLSSPIDFSSRKVINLDVWSPRPGGKLLFKLENLNDGNISVEKEVTLQGNSSWENVSVDFTDLLVPGESYQKLVWFFDYGTVGTGGADWTFYVDNIKQTSASYAPLLFDDFEGNGNITTWTGDAAGLDTSYPNPYVNADNFSDTVLEYTDTGGQYANVQFTAGSKFDLKSGQSVFTLKIYVPSSSITGSQPNQVSLKLQNSDLGGTAYSTQTEIIKPIVLDQWQTLTFDFANDTFVNFDANSPDPINRTDLDKVVIQVNSENNNDSVTAYIDDFNYGTMPPAETAPIARDGFEGFGTITTWAGDAAGLDTNFANPFIDAANGTPTVLQYLDTGGQYANVQFTVSPNFNLTEKNKFTLQIYVPSSGITGSSPNQISLKLQNSTLGGNAYTTQTEIIKPIVLDAWQTITFDFANDPFVNFDANSPDPVTRTDLDKVVIQVNGENNFDNVTAYIDNFNYHK